MWKLTRKGNEFAPKGTYWDSSNGEKTHLSEPGRLPGDETADFLRVPPIAMLLLGPILGLAYVIFMPLIGILMIMGLVGSKVVEVVVGGLRKVAVFNWEPGYAYLVRKKRRAADQEESTSEPLEEADVDSVTDAQESKDD